MNKLIPKFLQNQIRSFCDKLNKEAQAKEIQQMHPAERGRWCGERSLTFLNEKIAPYILRTQQAEDRVKALEGAMIQQELSHAKKVAEVQAQLDKLMEEKGDY